MRGGEPNPPRNPYETLWYFRVPQLNDTPSFGLTSEMQNSAKNNSYCYMTLGRRKLALSLRLSLSLQSSLSAYIHSPFWAVANLLPRSALRF